MQFFILLAKQPSITFRSCWKVSVQITRWWTRTVRVLGKTHVNANKIFAQILCRHPTWWDVVLHTLSSPFLLCWPISEISPQSNRGSFWMQIIFLIKLCKCIWNSKTMLSEQWLLRKGDRSQMGCTVLHQFLTWYFGTNFNCQFFLTILQCWVCPNVPLYIL